jgi:hypothetical protein
MSARFKPAPEAGQIAQALISQYHHHLIECDVRIEYAFVDEPTKTKGKEALATCRKVGSYAAYLATEDIEEFTHKQDPFFLISVWLEGWNSLAEDQKIALIDHELCHAFAWENPETGEVKISLLPHDIEEFNVVVKRHGIWLSDVNAFALALRDRQQPGLFDDEDKDVENVSLTIETSGMEPVHTDMKTLARVSRKLKQENHESGAIAN